MKQAKKCLLFFPFWANNLSSRNNYWLCFCMMSPFWFTWFASSWDFDAPSPWRAPHLPLHALAVEVVNGERPGESLCNNICPNFVLQNGRRAWRVSSLKLAPLQRNNTLRAGFVQGGLSWKCLSLSSSNREHLCNGYELVDAKKTGREAHVCWRRRWMFDY